MFRIHHRLSIGPARACLLALALACAGLEAQVFAQNGSEDCTSPLAISEGIYSIDTGLMLTSQDYSEGACGVLDFYQDMFWVYTATADGDLRVEAESTQFDTQLALYAGSDCTATCVAQNDDIAYPAIINSRILLPGVQVGDTFLIQTGGWRFESGQGTMSIFIDPPPPANDTCATAEPIAGAGMFPFDSTGGDSSDFETTHTCELAANNAFDHDVFFEWTATEAGDFRFTCAGSPGLSDTQLALYSGDCLTPTCLGSDDDSGENAHASIDGTGVSVGQTILIQIGGATGQMGAGDLIVERLPDGTSCELALPITGEGVFPFDTTGYATSAFTAAGCLTIEHDTFFEWEVAVDGDYIIDTRTTAFDTRLAAFAPDCMTPTCIDANDDIDLGGGTLTSEIQLNGLFSGEKVLLQIGGPMGANGLGEVTITRVLTACRMAMDDAFEDNDDCANATAVGSGSHTGLHLKGADPDFFTLSVPAGEILTWTETADSDAVDYRLYTDGICMSPEATSSTDLTYNNMSASPVVVIIEAHLGVGATTDCSDYDFDVALDPDPCQAMDDAFEENDTCGGASPLDAGTYLGLFAHANDSDFYALCVPDGVMLDCSIVFQHATGDLDAYLWTSGDMNCGGGMAGLALASSTTLDDDEALTWTNTTGQMAAVILELQIAPGTPGPPCNQYDLTILGADCTPPAGTAFCDPMDNNTTGAPTVLTGNWGSGNGSDLHLNVSGGPPSEFGYCLVGSASTEPGLTISAGRLCLSSTGGEFWGRYSIVGTEFNSTGQFDASGDFVNLAGSSTSGMGFDVPSSLPFTGSPTIQTGETWHFQVWHRDGPSTSNFSNGISVTF